MSKFGKKLSDLILFSQEMTDRVKRVKRNIDIAKKALAVLDYLDLCDKTDTTRTLKNI